MIVRCTYCKRQGEVPDDAPAYGPKGWLQWGRFVRACGRRCENRLNAFRVANGVKPYLFLPTLEAPEPIDHILRELVLDAAKRKSVEAKRGDRHDNRKD